MNLRLVRAPAAGADFILDVDELPKQRRRFAPQGMLPDRWYDFWGDAEVEVNDIPVCASTVLHLAAGALAGIGLSMAFGVLAAFLPGVLIGAGLSLAVVTYQRTKWQTRMNLMNLARNLAHEDFRPLAPPRADTSHLRLRSRSRLLTSVSSFDATMIRELDEGELAMHLIVRSDRINAEIAEGRQAAQRLTADEPVRQSVEDKIDGLNGEQQYVLDELHRLRKLMTIETDARKSLDAQEQAQKWLDGHGD